MNVLYEDGGKFKVAAVVQKNESSYQVDTQHGKRVKLKAAQIFVEFTQDMDQFLAQANNLAEEIDVDFLWEVAGEAEFTAEHLAKEYYGKAASGVETAALLIRIYDAPIYFYKKGKGVFKAAPAETLQAAKAAVERKQKQQAQKQLWIDQLKEGILPEEVTREIMPILHQPDKQNLIHQAFLEAATELKTNPLQLAVSLKAVNTVEEYLLGGFLLRQFPAGTGFPALPALSIPDLPLASVSAFSIDDENTSEMDDAFSVAFLENGITRIGVHIAVPTIAIEAESALEQMIFQRLSTVYFPNGKITMLPDDLVDIFSLNQGCEKPVLSLYFQVDQEYNISDIETRLEKIHIKENLRTGALEQYFNEQTIDDLDDGISEFCYQRELLFLYRLAGQMIQKRGQSDKNTKGRCDYTITVLDNGHVSISKRNRGAPIDLLVGELMIFTNVHWAGLLKEHQLPAIFRSQSGFGKVRMSTEAAEHSGMGVPQYAWCTSPLRRGCDYINQKQLLSLFEQPLRFPPKDVQIFGLMRAFETTYASYAAFQEEMEFYYTLKYLQQENIMAFEGSFIKEGVVRAADLPLVVKVTDTPEDWPGKRYLFAVKEIDLWTRQIAVSLEKAIDAECPEPNV